MSTLTYELTDFPGVESLSALIMDDVYKKVNSVIIKNADKIFVFNKQNGHTRVLKCRDLPLGIYDTKYLLKRYPFLTERLYNNFEAFYDKEINKV